MPREGRLTTPLAQRLLELRLNARLTQRDLATAFGKSVPLISSWESAAAVPPLPQLENYATLFGVARALVDGQARLLGDRELSHEETQARNVLLTQLTGLRGPIDRSLRPPIQRGPMPVNPGVDTIGGGLWHFPDQRPITIICSTLPDDELANIPNARASDPDYVESYRYADLDALIELHGHIRAVNPASNVSIRSGNDENVAVDDLTTHVVLLGGVDWNKTTDDFLANLKMPVRQVGRPSAEKLAYTPAEDQFGYFGVDDGRSVRRFPPTLDTAGPAPTLTADVALFYRGPNPTNRVRTITICNGMYGRGTFGVVRALTDVRFRDRNERYITDHFGGKGFGILSRVDIIGNKTMTPDWTSKDHRLFDWSDPDD